MSEQCSEVFREAFHSGHGSCEITCACGRTHFDTSTNNGWDWNEGELEGLIEKAAKEPDKYIGDDGTVTSLLINGLEIVEGCSCNFAKKYELFLIHSAEKIAHYLNKRADNLLTESRATRVEPCDLRIRSLEIFSKEEVANEGV